jgi:glyoxylase-like metal-dependent hydrolase (beta-lactamase superfamily II)
MVVAAVKAFRTHRVCYGDGSIVVVPAPGHTPGSVITFVTLPKIGFGKPGIDFLSFQNDLFLEGWPEGDSRAAYHRHTVDFLKRLV